MMRGPLMLCTSRFSLSSSPPGIARWHVRDVNDCQCVPQLLKVDTEWRHVECKRRWMSESFPGASCEGTSKAHLKKSTSQVCAAPAAPYHTSAVLAEGIRS